VDELLVNNNSHVNQTSMPRLIHQSNTMLWFPVTEMEIERVIKTLKGKPSAGIDEVPEIIVKKCSQFITKPLVHIFNALLASWVFPEKMKVAKIRPLYKKKGKKWNWVIIAQFKYCQFFQNI
jgi:DNA primase large subunit